MTPKYEDYQALIFKLAHRYHRYSGIEFDELVGWANLKFVECQKDYDPVLASFGTYLHIQIQGLFLGLAQKHWKTKDIELNLDTANQSTNNSTPENLLIFKQTLENLSSDAREVIKIIFNTPIDLINMTMRPSKYSKKVTKQQLEEYLRKQGWSFYRIWKTFKEIALALN
jgi:hypothetical protein